MNKNPYLEIYLKDKAYKEFVSLSEEHEDLSWKIKQALIHISKDIIQQVLYGILKNKRVFFYESDRTEYGLGISGFGYRSRWMERLDYDWRVIHNIKQEIINNSDKIRDGVKSNKRYIIDATIKAISKIPDIPNEIVTTTKPFRFPKKYRFDGDSIYKYGEIISDFGLSHYHYYHNGIYIIAKDDTKRAIHYKNLEDLFRYRHLHPEFIEALKKHNKKLERLKQKLERFSQSKEFIKLKDIYDTITMIENI